MHSPLDVALVRTDTDSSQCDADGDDDASILRRMAAAHDDEEIRANDDFEEDDIDEDDDDDDDDDERRYVDLSELSEIFKLGHSFSPEVQKSMLWVRRLIT